jgi:hypothetical protein
LTLFKCHRFIVARLVANTGCLFIVSPITEHANFTVQKACIGRDIHWLVPCSVEKQTKRTVDVITDLIFLVFLLNQIEIFSYKLHHITVSQRSILCTQQAYEKQLITCTQKLSDKGVTCESASICFWTVIDKTETVQKRISVDSNL